MQWDQSGYGDGAGHKGKNQWHQGDGSTQQWDQGGLNMQQWDQEQSGSKQWTKGGKSGMQHWDQGGKSGMQHWDQSGMQQADQGMQQWDQSDMQNVHNVGLNAPVPWDQGGCGGGCAPPELISQVKEMQRRDDTAKQQWIAYTSLQGGGIRDPGKHDAVFLQTYMDQYRSGARLQETGDDYSTVIKSLQKNSSHFKNAWAHFCNTQHGAGRNDPAKHPPSFHLQFFEALAKAMMGITTGMSSGEPSAKRMRVDSSGAVDPAKDLLVNAVKAWQRQGQDHKLQWEQHCDANVAGVRDPARHDIAILESFCATFGVNIPTAPPNGLGGGMPQNAARMGGPDPAKDGFVNAIKCFQRQGPEQKEIWSQHCDTNTAGVKDPNRHDVNALQDFCAMYSLQPLANGQMGGMSGGRGALGDDPASEGLINAVKAFQRRGEQEKIQWAQHCDVNCNGIKDPKRHDVFALQNFCAMYGLDVQSGGMGIGGMHASIGHSSGFGGELSGCAGGMCGGPTEMLTLTPPPPILPPPNMACPPPSMNGPPPMAPPPPGSIIPPMPGSMQDPMRRI